MTELRIGDRTIDATVIKVRAGAEKDALAAMANDKRDNVAFKLGSDTFIATAKQLDLKGVEPWVAVEYGGRKGDVREVSRESWAKGWLKKVTALGGVVGAVAACGIIGMASLMWGFPGLVVLGVAAAAGVVGGGSMFAGLESLRRLWHNHQAKQDKLAKYAA